MDTMDVDDPLHVRLFARAPVYDLVFACLSPRSLVRLALTCRSAYFAVGEFKTRAFNINRHFSRYFADPIAFRSLQAKTDTLISGSNALQFLDRTFYPEADLDLYTHPGHSLEIAQFLIESEGYRYTPRELQAKDWKTAIADWEPVLTERRVIPCRSINQAYPTTGIQAVLTFEKIGANQECLKVQIIQARSSPLEVILKFHSTCVMNLISSDAAYSLYPVATFENRSSLGMPASRSTTEAIQKYVRRGWRIYFMPTPDDPAFFLDQVRWVSDEHTWKIPLDQTGVKGRVPLSQNSVPLTCDPVLFNGWELGLPSKWAVDHEQEFEGYGYECHYYPLSTTLFRYNYAIPDETLQLAIREWAVHQGTYSHRQVSKEDWIWFDADIPKFLGLK